MELTGNSWIANALTVNGFIFNSKNWLVPSFSSATTKDTTITFGVSYLALGSDSHMALDRGIFTQVEGLLDAEVSQNIFSKNGSGVHVGSHEPTVS